jgi:hypothetical protein
MARPYESLFVDLLCGRVDLLRGTVKVLLVAEGYRVRLDRHSRRSDIEGECRGKGYVAGGVELAGRQVVLGKTAPPGGVTIAGTAYGIGEMIPERFRRDEWPNRAFFLAGNPFWPEVSVRAIGAVVYQAGDSGHLSRDILICYEDFGEEKSASDGEFEIAWPGGVVMSLGIKR